MFICFANNKTHYEKGQIFPFLIAITALLIIAFMITLNAGQLTLFRTDASNAADAGALAAASVLSGELLALGLKSEQMCGQGLVCTIAIIIAACFPPYGTAVAIAIAIAYYISQILAVIKCWGETRVAWSNAKKTAMQYAFNNAGIDEPRPTFEQFLRACGVQDPRSLDAASLISYNNEYTRLETDRARYLSQSGLAHFMDWDKIGFARPIGRIRPSNASRYIVTSGYGWTSNPDATITNSFGYIDSGGSHNAPGASTPDRFESNSYRQHANYVEVTVQGASQYNLFLYMTAMDLAGIVFDAIMERATDNAPWWFVLIAGIIAIFVAMICPLFGLLPFGLSFAELGETGVRNATDNNPISVHVKRYKANNRTLGLWIFKYGAVGAKASAHAYMKTGHETIEPTIFHTLIQCLVDGLSSWDFSACTDGLVNTQHHLFETELMRTQ